MRLPTTPMRAPVVPLVANVTPALERSDEIRNALVDQVTGTVRWRECMGCMAADGR